MKRNPKFYLMVGYPRSGKSTWVEENRKGKIAISNDWIRENILHASHNNAQDPAIWMIVDSSMRIALSQGFDVILDGVNGTKAVRKYFINTAVDCGAEIIIVYIHTSIQNCYDRNNSTKKLPDIALSKMINEMEPPSKSECHELIIVDGNGKK